ncbi:unnamed protein product [Bursaphelenchus okinawaensis]|uniref:Protein kinase domain-containing protein n=1 Tax=Bursaphelenchus okinawaensis TaxID=465554 RepID=A0A811L8Y7_9BILA|nr:unnamed protein product [Bursaphelenchus okinawaensis]CAG9121271.1 unnamed protein product [Bursaphelenchus okinawaensis]
MTFLIDFRKKKRPRQGSARPTKDSQRRTAQNDKKPPSSKPGSRKDKNSPDKSEKKVLLPKKKKSGSRIMRNSKAPDSEANVKGMQSEKELPEPKPRKETEVLEPSGAQKSMAQLPSLFQRPSVVAAPEQSAVTEKVHQYLQEKSNMEADNEDVPDPQNQLVDVKEGKCIELRNERTQALKGAHLIKGDMRGEYGRVNVEILNEEGEPDGQGHYQLLYEHDNAAFKRLRNECMVLTLGVASQQNCFQRLFLRGIIEDTTFNYVLLEGLGTSLPNVVNTYYNGVLCQPDACRLALMTLECVKAVHRASCVHRDVKPSVFFFGSGRLKCKLYITNLGLSYVYRSPRTLEPFKPRETVPFMGSLKYAPRRSHQRKERYPIDDIESWYYMISEFYEPTILPWSSTTKSGILDQKTDFLLTENVKQLVEREKLPKFFVKLRETVELDPKNPYDQVSYKAIRDVLHEELKSEKVGLLTFMNEEGEYNNKAQASSNNTSNRQKNSSTKEKKEAPTAASPEHDDDMDKPPMQAWGNKR